MGFKEKIDAAVERSRKAQERALQLAEHFYHPGRRVYFRRGNMSSLHLAKILRLRSWGLNGPELCVRNLKTGRERWIHYTDIVTLR